MYVYDSIEMKFKNRQNSAVRSQDNAYFWRGKSEQWVGRSKTRFWVILFVLTWAVPTRVCWFCRNGWAVQLWFMFFSVYILYLKKFFFKGREFLKGAQQLWQHWRPVSILAPGKARSGTRQCHNPGCNLWLSSILLLTSLPQSLLSLESVWQRKTDEAVRLVNSVVNIVYS